MAKGEKWTNADILHISTSIKGTCHEQYISGIGAHIWHAEWSKWHQAPGKVYQQCLRQGPAGTVTVCVRDRCAGMHAHRKQMVPCQAKNGPLRHASDLLMAAAHKASGVLEWVACFGSEGVQKAVGHRGRKVKSGHHSCGVTYHHNSSVILVPNPMCASHFGAC